MTLAWQGRPSSPRPRLRGACDHPYVVWRNHSANPILSGKVSSPVGEPDQAMQSVSPIMLAASRAPETRGFRSYALIHCADEVKVHALLLTDHPVRAIAPPLVTRAERAALRPSTAATAPL